MRRDTGELLAELRYRDEQAVRLYDAALARVTDPGTAERMRAHRDDHARHVRAFDELAGGAPVSDVAPPEAVRAALEARVAGLGVAQAESETLERLLLAEDAMDGAYESALALRMSEDVTRLLEANRADEHRHVAYLEVRVPAGTVPGPGGPG